MGTQKGNNLKLFISQVIPLSMIYFYKIDLAGNSNLIRRYCSYPTKYGTWYQSLCNPQASSWLEKCRDKHLVLENWFCFHFSILGRIFETLNFILHIKLLTFRAPVTGSTVNRFYNTCIITIHALCAG